MIDDEGLPGVAVHERDRVRQVAREDEHVVDEAEPLQRGHAAVEIAPQHVPIVRLVVDDVPEAFERPIHRQPLDVRLNRRHDERHPPDDPADDRVLVGEAEQPLRLGNGVLRLHGDRARHPGARERGIQSRGPVVALEQRHRIRDPGIRGRLVRPEVMVGVDAGHWRTASGLLVRPTAYSAPPRVPGSRPSVSFPSHARPRH